MAEQDPVEIATRALQHRDRSRREVDARLARAGIDEARRHEALDRLERVGYIVDERFAGARAGALANRGYGDEWIRHDLGEQGVAPEAVEDAIGALLPERERAAALVERLGRSRKTGSQLARKGFGADALEAALGVDVAE
ncbi:MAG: RecX family [Gaiellaceae bacterium]|nr:RecX family [Gaiellaceae bacterium]